MPHHAGLRGETEFGQESEKAKEKLFSRETSFPGKTVVVSRERTGEIG